MVQGPSGASQPDRPGGVLSVLPEGQDVPAANRDCDPWIAKTGTVVKRVSTTRTEQTQASLNSYGELLATQGSSTSGNPTIRVASQVKSNDSTIQETSVTGLRTAVTKAHHKVDYEASRDEALEAFDQLVRQELPPAFSSAVGRYISFSYGQVVVMSFVASWSMSIDVLGGLGEAHEHQRRQIVAGFCIYFVWGLVAYPFFWALREFVASFFLHWRGWKNIFWVCFSQLATAAVGFPVLSLFNRVREKADESDLAFAFIIAFTIACTTFGSYGISLLFSIGDTSFSSSSGPAAPTETSKEAKQKEEKEEKVTGKDLETASDEGFRQEDFTI